ncbi:DAD family protein [Podospora conica]|nr:DAD family protein [Schizothecium conicum]
MAKPRSVTPSGAASKPAAAAKPAAPQQPAAVAPPAPAVAIKPKSSPSASTWSQVVVNLTKHYQKATPQRTKLIDAFMAFLVAVGVLQFVYCVLAGNFPFNAFLSGFSATVGQFVLTASLRIQTNEANKSDFPAVSPERAFADYVVCSLILHFFCVNFIN